MTDNQYCRPMRVQARQGSDAERYYFAQSSLPGAPFPPPRERPQPAAIARGIAPDPFEDLIVAETFVGLLLRDSSSFLSQDPLWTPSLGINGTFGLRDLIRVALQG